MFTNILKYFFSFLYLQTVTQVVSNYNGLILVKEFFGKKYLEVGGLTQSEGAMRHVFVSGFKKIFTSFVKSKPENCLILGIGGGTIIREIQKIYPDIQITAIEIDPKVIEIANKYFQLNRVKNLEIKTGDAFVLINKLKDSFDLIVVDLFCGFVVPEDVSSELFLKNLQNIMTKKGVVIFNRLYFQNYIFEANKFLDKIQKIFHCISTVKIRSNILIVARK